MMLLRANKNSGLVGVDFGTHSVKLAQIAVTGKRIGVQAAAVIPRVDPWHYDLSNVQKGISSVAELDVAKCINRDFVGKQASASLSMAVCDVRRISMPDQSKLTFDQLVQNELSSIERFKGVERQFEYWETERAFSDTGPPANVLSVPKFWTLQCMSDLHSAGFECEQLDGVPFSLARAYSLFEDSDEPVALLDWGYSRATICIIQHGYPKFVRMLRRSGFRFVVDEVCKGFEIDAEMARIVTSQYGLEDLYANNDVNQLTADEIESISIQQTLHDFILEPINAIAKEVNRTIRFLENQQKALMPKKMVLFGGGASLKNVIPLLESKVRMQTEVWGSDIAVSVPGNISMAVLANAISMSALPFVDSSQPDSAPPTAAEETTAG